MFVGLLSLELHIPESGSLKSKRRILRCLKDRIRSRFNASVSEVDHQDKWQRALLGIACVGGDKKYLDGILCRIVDLVRDTAAAELIDFHKEIR